MFLQGCHLSWVHLDGPYLLLVPWAVARSCSVLMRLHLSRGCPLCCRRELPTLPSSSCLPTHPLSLLEAQLLCDRSLLSLVSTGATVPAQHACPLSLVPCGLCVP